MVREDFLRSAIRSVLRAYLHILNTADGQDWLKNQSVYLHIVHMCIMDFQIILGKFASVATTLNHRQRLSLGDFIDDGPLRVATNQSQQVVNKL
jgi:hypothetical protein